MAGREPSSGQRRARIRLIVRVTLSVLVVGALFYFVFKRIDLPGVWAEIQAMTWRELVTIAAIAVWNLTTYWVLWRAVTPGLSYRRAAVLAQSGTAVTNAVPGGSAIGVGLAYAMLDSWGFSRARSTVAVLVSGVWNTFIKFSLPVLALAIVALQGAASALRILVGLAGLALLVAAVTTFVLVLRSDRAAGRVGALAGGVVSRLLALVRRPAVVGWDAATVKFRSRAEDLVRRRWLLITVVALVSHLSLYLVLLVSLRHVGVGDEVVGWATVLAVFATARLATMIRFTPGGAGVVEAILIGGLVAAGGPEAGVTAAVLVFRALTWLLPVPLGVLTYLGWRGKHLHRRSAAPTPATVKP